MLHTLKASFLLPLSIALSLSSIVLAAHAQDPAKPQSNSTGKTNSSGISPSTAVEMGLSPASQTSSTGAQPASSGTPASSSSIGGLTVPGPKPGQQIVFTEAQRLVNEGVELSKKDKTDEAIALFNRAIEIDRRCVSAHYNLGNEYKKKKQNYAEAISHYKSALGIDQNYYKAWNMLGVCYKHTADLSGAEEAFQKALSINPNDYDSLCNLGFLYASMHRNNDARKILLQAKALPESRTDDELAEMLLELDRQR